MRTLIRNALIMDGSGEKPFLGDVLLEDALIAAVGTSISVPDHTEILDADGKMLCPGFIDVHRHADLKPLFPWDAAQELKQGITTVVSGNCGISLTPSSEAYRKEQYAFSAAVVGNVQADADMPFTYGDYRERLLNKPLPLSFAAMIGTGAVRISLKGFSPAPFTEQELRMAENAIEEALQLGAPGVSCGIMYIPECYTTFEEYAKILRPLGKYRPPLTAHIRGEGDGLVDSVKEVIRIAETVGCPLQISHFKSCGMQNWGREIYKAIEQIEQAHDRGVDVTCDFYPYCGGSTMLTTMLPPVLCADGVEEACIRLGSTAGLENFREAARKTYSDWDNYAVTLGWDRILITTVSKAENRRFLGLSVSQAATQFGFADAEALAAYLMHTEGNRCGIINLSMDQADVDVVAKLPYSMLISDALYAETDTPHPRLLGAFPRFLREYAYERKVISPETAIRKMTAMPAERFGFSDRGYIRPGYRADLLLFDPSVFTDNADFSGRSDMASGLYRSFIGGVTVVEEDRLTGKKPGGWLQK